MRTKRVLTRSEGIPETLADPLVCCADPDCRVEFIPLRPWHRYHSPRCRARHWLRQKTSAPKTANSPTQAAPKARRLSIFCVVELN